VPSSRHTERDEELGDAFYKSLYEQAPEMIAVVDMDSGDIFDCNRTFADSIDAPKEQVIGTSIDAFVAQTESSGRKVSTKLTTCSDGDLRNVEVDIDPTEGDSFLAALNATHVDESEPPLARIILYDITELKETQNDLEQQTQRLKQSNQELEQFAYLASHDLQEPLRMVASYTQLLARRFEGEIDDQADKYIRYAVEGAERMKALLSDLLEYSRIGRNDQVSDLHDANSLMDEVVANLSVRIAETKGDVEYDDLPEVYGVRSQLRQLFQNLVENGLKFCEDGPPRVSVRGRHTDGTVVFEIEDQGIGFDTDNASRIFQVFQRLHERDRFEGTGAGLSIVKKVIDYHDGAIEVDSQPGEGTTFRIRLPHPT
jgi:PAS domain S-box-containing protein